MTIHIQGEIASSPWPHGILNFRFTTSIVMESGNIKLDKYAKEVNFNVFNVPEGMNSKLFD